MTHKTRTVRQKRACWPAVAGAVIGIGVFALLIAFMFAGDWTGIAGVVAVLAVLWPGRQRLQDRDRAATPSPTEITACCPCRNAKEDM